MNRLLFVPILCLQFKAHMSIPVGGQWEGETPAPENVEIIAYLDAVRTVPSNEQYLPSLGVFDLIELLLSSQDGLVLESIGAVLSSLHSQELLSQNRHTVVLRKTLDDLLKKQQN